MKKLIIFPGYFPPHVGGLESHVDELAKRLSKKGFKITIFAPNIPKTKEKEKINKNLEIIRYPAFEVIQNFPMPKFWNKKYNKSLNKFKSENFDFVMSRTRFFISSFAAYLFARKNKIKFVHVEHGSDYIKLGSWWKDLIARIYDHTLGAIVIKNSDICIAISHAVLDFLKKFRKKGDIPVITRGVDFDYIDKIKANLKIKAKYKDKIIIGFAGRIIHWKGLQNALEGFNKLDKKVRNKCVFLVIGNGQDFDKLKDKYEDKNILFLGRKTRDETISLMKSLDIYVHSTISGGGLSNALLEGMATNNAIIATKAEGADEVLNYKSAILINSSNPKLFQKSFQILINNKKTQKRLSNNANKFVKDNFNWDNKIEQYLKVLR